MRAILLCITLLLFGLDSEAQTTIASLNITLTDVQSVTFSSAAFKEVASGSKQEPIIAEIKVLSSSTSQIKKISPANSEYERLYNIFYDEKASSANSSSSGKIYNLALNNSTSAREPENRKISNLVIYQIDPR